MATTAAAAAAAAEEALKSNYRYNMIFNNTSTNNDEDDVKFNTNLISDFDLQNFDPKRYEYYVNLLKMFNNDPETLSKLLNKYNSVKTLKGKERKIIREISDYVNKLKDIESNEGNASVARQAGGGINSELKSKKERAQRLIKDVEKLSSSGYSIGNTAFNTAIGAFKKGIETFKNGLNFDENKDAYNANNTTINTFKNNVGTFNLNIDTYNKKQNGGMSLKDLLIAKDTTAPRAASAASAPTLAAIAPVPSPLSNIIPVSALDANERLLNNTTAANATVAAKKKDNLIKEARRLVEEANKLIKETQDANNKMNAKIDEDINEFERIILGELEEGKKKDAKETAKEKEREKRNRDIKALKGLFAIERDKIKAALKGKKQIQPAEATEEESEEEEDSEVSEVSEDKAEVGEDSEVRNAERELEDRKGRGFESNRSNMSGRFFKSYNREATGDTIGRIKDKRKENNDDDDNNLKDENYLLELREEIKKKKEEARLAEEGLEQQLKEQRFQETQSSPTGEMEKEAQRLLPPTATPTAPTTRRDNDTRGKFIISKKKNLPEQPRKEVNDMLNNLDNAEELQVSLDKAEQEKAKKENEERLAKERLENLAILKQLKRQPSSQGKDISDVLFGSLNKGLEERKRRTLAEPPNYIVGGAADEYNDDTLKARYLEARPQRYSRITLDDPKINDLRNANKENKERGSEDTDNKIEQLSNDIDVYNGLSSAEKDNPIKNNEMIEKIKRFEDDPKNPLEELELTFDDRIVFIIATFFVRYITIIMVQWCIDINIIKTFYEGFIYYAVIYIILFWFIVLFINIDNSFDVKYMNFNGIINSIRTLFYYFYMGTNGISRLLIHTSLILLLIVIPIILNIKKSNEYKPDDEGGDSSSSAKILDFEERKQLSKALSLFTMFIWLFTSIIATKF
jgi:hypothetical protein